MIDSLSFRMTRETILEAILSHSNANEPCLPSENLLIRLMTNDPSLNVINLQHGLCTDITLITLTEALAGNRTVHQLLLDGNQITDLGAHLIAMCLLQNNYLSEISLLETDISDDGAKAIEDALEFNSSVTNMLVPCLSKRACILTSFNKIGEAAKRVFLQTFDEPIFKCSTATDIHILELQSAIMSLQTLREIDLSYSLITDDSCRVLTKCLRNSSVNVLSIQKTRVTAEGLAVFADFLKENETLQRLEADYEGSTAAEEILWLLKLNRGPPLLKSVCLKLKARDESFRCLSIGNSAHEPGWTDDDIALLCEQICVSNHLVSFEFHSDRLSRNAVISLASVLQENKALHAIDFSKSNLGNDAVIIAKALEVNQSLLVCRVAECQLSDDVGASFGQAMACNASLTLLDLSNNDKLESRTAVEILAALRYNTSLKEIILEGTSILREKRNQILDWLQQSAVHIDIRDTLEKAKQSNISSITLNGESANWTIRDDITKQICMMLPPLTSLNISHNKITVEGAREIVESLVNSHHERLRYVNFSFNDIGKTIGFALLVVRMLVTCTALEEIDVSSTNFSNEGAEILFKFLLDTQTATLKSLNLDGNPQVLPSLAAQIQLLVSANSFVPQVRGFVKSKMSEWKHKQYTCDNENLVSTNLLTIGVLGQDFVRTIFSLVNLRQNVTGLNLSSNCLGDEAVEVLCEKIASYPKLTSISLANNNLTDLSADFLARCSLRNYFIKDIDISGNPSVTFEGSNALRTTLEFNRQPEFIKDALLRMSRANESEISFEKRVTKHISDRQVPLLVAALDGNKLLQKISLGNNHIGNVGLETLCDFLARNPRVTKLSLTNTMINGRKAGTLISRLVAESGLISLDVSQNDINDEAAKIIFNALERNVRMTDLNLSGCSISQRTLQEILVITELNRIRLHETRDRLFSNDALLTELDLSSRGLCYASFRGIAAAMHHNTFLAHLSLRCNQLTDEIVEPFICSLGSNSSLEMLSLDNNCLGDVSLRALINALLTNCHMKCITAVGNAFSFNCVRDIVEDRRLFDRNDTLQTFAFSNPGYAPYDHFVAQLTTNAVAGFKALLRALPISECAIYVVDFSMSAEFNDPACAEFAKALENNSSVCRVNFSGTSVSDAGVIALSRAFFINSSVESVEIRSCAVTDRGAQSIADALKVNSHLKNVDLRDTAITIAGVRALRKAAILSSSIISIFSDIEDSDGSLNTAVLLNKAHPLLKDFIFLSGELVIEILDLSSAKAEYSDKTFDDESCRVLCESMYGNKFVKRIDLANNDLTFQSCIFIAKMLETNSTVECISLENNCVRDGVIYITQALKHNDALQQLSVCGCGVSLGVIEDLQLMLDLNKEPLKMKRTSLDVLSFESNCVNYVVRCCDDRESEHDKRQHRKTKLDDFSMDVVRRVLPNALSVKVIDFSFNRIGDVGFQTICEALISHRGIREIAIANNLIGDTSIEALCRLCRELSILRKVDLSWNRVKEDGGRLVTQLLTELSGIDFFAMEGNKLEPATEDLIAFLIRCNTICSEEARISLQEAFTQNPTRTNLCFDGYRSGERRKMSKNYFALIFEATATSFVTRISLENCGIDDQLLGCFAISLKNNRAIRKISLELAHLSSKRHELLFQISLLMQLKLNRRNFATKRARSC